MAASRPSTPPPAPPRAALAASPQYSSVKTDALGMNFPRGQPVQIWAVVDRPGSPPQGGYRKTVEDSMYRILKKSWKLVTHEIMSPKDQWILQHHDIVGATTLEPFGINDSVILKKEKSWRDGNGKLVVIEEGSAVKLTEGPGSSLNRKTGHSMNSSRWYYKFTHTKETYEKDTLSYAWAVQPEDLESEAIDEPSQPSYPHETHRLMHFLAPPSVAPVGGVIVTLPTHISTVRSVLQKRWKILDICVSFYYVALLAPALETRAQFPYYTFHYNLMSHSCNNLVFDYTLNYIGFIFSLNRHFFIAKYIIYLVYILLRLIIIGGGAFRGHNFRVDWINFAHRSFNIVVVAELAGITAQESISAHLTDA
ncbi:hypothetical protein BD410DRAFT_802350 [Rickenella mellea]|uniref:Uncharacterized protein n=1 Tax=Rickenella mellea TaxID=50990 RepID=A0A4Y7QB66_9AGAM|nr:hypothetical protein BD410DRAFT_802350 [Rickenella mellea]